MDRQADLYTIIMEQFPHTDPAWNLLDAFDAVTNGMENPDAMKKALSLSDPLFTPWKQLITAIEALYAGNTEGCRKAAEAIPDDSPPGSLKPVFRAWEIRHRTGDPRRRDKELFTVLTGCCEPAVELFRRLIIDPHPMALIAEQAEEALRQGLEEQFTGLAARIIGSLREQSSLLAFRYAVYCLCLMNDSDSRGEDFFQTLQKCLGEANAFCALGFALAGRDNHAAAMSLDTALKTVPSQGKGNFFLGEKHSPSLETLSKILKTQTGKKTRRRFKKNFAQPELFFDDPVFVREERPGPDPASGRDKLLSLLRGALSGEDFTRIELSLQVPGSFDELAAELPPAARYLGPGIWIKTIKDSINPVY
ncbi:MAG: hypothetical protein LBP60_05515 [Spirochaetaceae bacterium]|jgi:hypothetical protein|nr:hypothetical protein [Spirochaetaceae bacterium]